MIHDTISTCTRMCQSLCAHLRVREIARSSRPRGVQLFSEGLQREVALPHLPTAPHEASPSALTGQCFAARLRRLWRVSWCTLRTAHPSYARFRATRAPRLHETMFAIMASRLLLATGVYVGCLSSGLDSALPPGCGFASDHARQAVPCLRGARPHLRRLRVRRRARGPARTAAGSERACDRAGCAEASAGGGVRSARPRAIKRETPRWQRSSDVGRCCANDSCSVRLFNAFEFWCEIASVRLLSGTRAILLAFEPFSSTFNRPGFYYYA